MLLGAVKEMLLGDELKYFFNERVMDFLQSFAGVLYPGKWLANFMLKRERLFSGLGILIMLIVCLILSMTMIRAILTRALQSRIAGGENFIYPKGVFADLPHAVLYVFLFFGGGDHADDGIFLYVGRGFARRQTDRRKLQRGTGNIFDALVRFAHQRILYHKYQPRRRHVLFRESHARQL